MSNNLGVTKANGGGAIAVMADSQPLAESSGSGPGLALGVTADELALWGRCKKYNLRPVWFPDLDISEEFIVEGHIKPEPSFYMAITKEPVRSFECPPTVLKRGIYLVDFTTSVDYSDGTQVWPDDPLAPLIERLRREKKISKSDKTPLGSRFDITFLEWIGALLPALAQEVKLEPNRVRLERLIEFNWIGNYIDTNRGKFNSYELFADPYAGKQQFVGGIRDWGGIAMVQHIQSDCRSNYVAGRPIVLPA